MVKDMAKGPGTLYNECLADAYEFAKCLDADPDGTTDVPIREMNEKLSMNCLYETDVLIKFMSANYGSKKTERCIRNWADLRLIWRGSYKGFRLIAFEKPALNRIKVKS